MGNPLETKGPLSLEQHGALNDLARRFGWRLIVLFGSLARGENGRDVDLAVLPTAETGLMEQGRWLASLEKLFAPRAVDLLVLHDGLAPLTRFEVFRCGQCLFEAQADLFSGEQDRAFFLYADTEKFRRAEREALRDRPPA
jgi:predicted nucleotidyltransferase